VILYPLCQISTFRPRRLQDMSGGWRMRVALARALNAEPTLLLVRMLIVCLQCQTL
jgi:ABC-type sulfate/molybdate transport systems ATPase subunit